MTMDKVCGWSSGSGHGQVLSAYFWFTVKVHYNSGIIYLTDDRLKLVLKLVEVLECFLAHFVRLQLLQSCFKISFTQNRISKNNLYPILKRVKTHPLQRYTFKQP